jgi:pyrroline-5-carboxylate reductase
MMSAKIAVIGAGNMGASLLSGLIKNGCVAENIWVTDPDSEKLEGLKKQFRVNTTFNNSEATQFADVVILAVKPQILQPVATEIASIVKKNKALVLSIAAGMRIASIQKWVGDTVAIVRAMPNTPALIGCGASALFANVHVSADQRHLAESILNAVGITVWVENEKLLDAVTALSGSGPAYFFLIIEALQNAAQQLGLSAEVAKLLTLQTAYGATRMALESQEDIVKLRRNVTSPGGTTEQAVKVLEDENIRALLAKTLQAANRRAEELAEILGK